MAAGWQRQGIVSLETKVFTLNLDTNDYIQYLFLNMKNIII
jgi:hypothetical protein